MEAGANQKVSIDNGVVLDFGGLFGAESDKKTPSEMPVEPRNEEGEYKNLAELQKPSERLKTGLEREQAKTLIIDHRRTEEDHRRSLEVYKTYQENIKVSSQLQTDILKGVKSGESIYSLFLKAAKAISLMTSNNVFYSQIEADISVIYGEGLQEQEPLKKQLEDTQKRLQRLLEMKERDKEHDSRERISRAIQTHEEKIAQLTEQIQRTNNSI